ncbi:MAG: ComF family protein [Verrucomicrobiota bacterium]
MLQSYLRKFYEGCIDLVYPQVEIPGNVQELKEPFCNQCGDPLSSELNKRACANCRGRTWGLDQARAAYLAEDGVREVIHGFKYEQKSYYYPTLIKWLKEGFDRFYARDVLEWQPQALVPVPLHFSRLRKRGFNQAEELAKGLSKLTGLPVWKAIRKVKPTQVQASLRKSQRLKNQVRVYDLKRGFDVCGARLLIIDDVFTTGATVDSCARVLLKHHADSVCSLTVARG